LRDIKGKLDLPKKGIRSNFKYKSKTSGLKFKNRISGRRTNALNIKPKSEVNLNGNKNRNHIHSVNNAINQVIPIEPI
jgi:hypothetical protein